MTRWTAIGATLLKSAEYRSQREQAACWLLAESGAFESHWPDRLERAGLLAWEVQDDKGWDLVYVRWVALEEQLKSTDHDPYDGLYGNDAEWCMLRFACSLMTGKGGEWGPGLSSLDANNRRILLGAITWAAKGRDAAYAYILDDQPQPNPKPPGPPKLRSV